MSSLKSPGLILKKTPFSDSSLILKAYTRESGLVTLMAKGAKRPQSRFRGLLDFFTLDQFVYPAKSRTEIHTLTDASLIREFPRLKADPARQALANVLLELYLKYLPEPSPSPPHFELLVERLERIDEAREAFDPVLELCDFLLALCAVSGFSPQFSACAHCGNDALGFRTRLDPEAGGPVCAACAASGLGAGPSYPARLLRWLTRVQESGARAGRLPREEEAQAENFLLSFLGKHAGGARPVKSLDFYRQMLDPI